MTLIFNQQLELVVPSLRSSPYSSEQITDWENATFQLVPFLVSVQPVGTTEGPVERPQVSASFRLYTPIGTDIPELSAESRVRLGGTLTLSVEGAPERWPDPFNPGVVHHVEATLERVEG